MFEQVQLVRTFLRMAWLYRWPGMVAATLLSVLGWGFVQSLPDTYEVKAKVFLDSRSMLRPLLSGVAFNTGAASDAALLLSRTLLTRPNLEDVARRADLDIKASTPEEFTTIVDDLTAGIRVNADRQGGDIYDVAYVERDPILAKKVVDELLNIFMEQSLGDARRDSASTQKFLDEQIAAYEQRLVDAEDRLKRFKQKNVGVMPGSQGGFFARMQEAQATLNEAKLKLDEARRRRDQLKSEDSAETVAYGEDDLMAALDDGPGGRRSHPELTVFDNKISDLEGRIDELLLQYTDKHPDIVAMRRLIDEHRKRKESKAQELAALPPDLEEDMAPGAPGASFKQQLRLEAAQADATVAALETRVEVYSKRLDELEKKVDVVPEIEAELVRLNRDYGITKNQYDELVERRERMRLGMEAEQSVDEVKIKLIEPPRMPVKPTGPPRIFLSSLVLLVALGAGAGLSALLSQLNPRLIDVPDVTNLTGLPVLGVVGMISSVAHRQQRRVELGAFFSVLGVLFMLYAGQVSLHLLGFNVHGKIATLLGVGI